MAQALLPEDLWSLIAANLPVAGQVFEGMSPLHKLQEHFDSWREANADRPVLR